MAHLKPQVSQPAPSAKAVQIQALVILLVLGYYFVWGVAENLWSKYWLVKDGRQASAFVIGEHWAGHDNVVYEYQVKGTVYTGRSHRSTEKLKYAHVMSGGTTVVYFSSSHPWLSAIDPPHFVGIDGLFPVLLVWFLMAGLAVTAVDPKSRWAFKLVGREKGSYILADDQNCGAQPKRRLGRAKEILRIVAWALIVVLGMTAVDIGLGMLGHR